MQLWLSLVWSKGSTIFEANILFHKVQTTESKKQTVGKENTMMISLNFKLCFQKKKKKKKDKFKLKRNNFINKTRFKYCFINGIQYCFYIFVNYKI